MKKLENKIAVVTGGNSGMGLATAKLFAAQGAKVAITGLNQKSLDSAAAEIGHNAIGLVSDATNIKSLDGTFKHITDWFGGKIDVLIVNAGVFLGAPLADFTEEQFDQTTNVNFKGAFFAVQKALPYLNDGASIAMTSSALNDKGQPTAAAYSASKAAVRSLAIDTPIYGRTGGTAEQVQGAKDYFASLNPSKRLGTAEEIAAGFLYLASDDSRYMVGGELVLDGGVKTL
jgi:NAD(P)-dependent dehydrogenase (short-subunit alcohol dehydrogenase family)